FNRHTPELADFISQLRVPKNFEKVLRERFSKLPRISFDYAIMEKAHRVLVVEATFDWDDIGSWRAVSNYFKNDEQGNAAKCAINRASGRDRSRTERRPCCCGDPAPVEWQDRRRRNRSLAICGEIKSDSSLSCCRLG